MECPLFPDINHNVSTVYILYFKNIPEHNTFYIMSSQCGSLLRHCQHDVMVI